MLVHHQTLKNSNKTKSKKSHRH